MRFWLTSLTIILMLVLPLSAMAKGKTPAWNLRQGFDQNGRFSFCLMEKDYADGKKMIVAMNPKDELNLGFSIPKAGFVLGKHYDLAVGLPDGASRRVLGQALDENTVLLPFGADLKWRHALAHSRKLEIGAGNGQGKNVSFVLAGIEPGFARLQKCLKDNAGHVDKRAAAVDHILPASLQALLVTAGFTDIEPVPLDTIPPEKRPADFAWKLGPIMSGVRERQMPPGKSVDDLAHMHLAALKEKCTGAFRSMQTAPEHLPGLSLMTADAECDFPDHPIFAAVLYYVTGDGKFTLFTNEGAIADKSEAIADRDRLARAVRTLATQNAGQ